MPWDGATKMALVKNALYCPGGRAVDASGLQGAGRMIVANLTEGTMAGAVTDGSQFAVGGTASLAFVQPEALDLWPRPTSMLIGAGSARLGAERDFNGTLRRAPYDVGAYQTTASQANPGWRLTGGFKGRSPLSP